MKAQSIRNRINTLASEKTPFLFAVDYELKEGILIENPLQQKDILFKIPGASNSEINILSNSINKSLSVNPEPFDIYNKKYQIVMDGLQNGECRVVNLTINTPIQTSLSLQQIFDLSNAPYCLYVPDKFVCFSPERFVKINSGIISANPMKGTINADIPDAENIILNDKKEVAEHTAIVELMKDELGLVAENVKVAKFRYIDRLTTGQREILQVSSEIEGELSESYLSKLGDIIFQLLPAASISGTPKRSSIEIIRRAEQIPRGYYTGVFGYFDGQDFDSAVMIRFIEEQNGIKSFRSGGGITIASDPHHEYNEAIEKIYLPFV